VVMQNFIFRFAGHCFLLVGSSRRFVAVTRSQ
jgi:hypothetical protein